MDVDFSDMGTDDLESGGSVNPGWYRCVVAEVKDNQFQAGNVDVELHVTHGPFKGAKIFDTIMDPNNASDTDKAKKVKQRLAMWVTRSGMKSKEDLAKQNVTLDFTELIGKEVMVKAVEDNYSKTESDGSVSKKSRVKPAFDGIYALDDERVPEDVRKKNGVTAKPKPPPDMDGNKIGVSGMGPKPPTPPAAPPSKGRVDKSRL